jgi:hypothetical protein
MQALRDILRDRLFWISVGAIWSVQFTLLLLTTPLYDIDTNSYIRGGLSWDIYHNPLLNILIAACSKIWSNAWFVLWVQLGVFAFCSAFLARVLFGRGKWIWAALAVASLEPITLYYNFSFLSESLFLSFTLLSVALFILWMRHSGGAPAFLTGLGMGLAFTAKLSAVTHAPLLLLFLLKPGRPRRQRIEGFALAVMPFIGLYALIYLGQTLINQGDLYTVEGRVRWDFSSSMYDSTEVDAPEFKQYVHPYLYPNGEFVMHRELRRELTYLGYKDCVASYERKGFRPTYGINTCDSLFGAAASQIMQKHFWEAESRFIQDNFHFIHHLNYIDYRFTPGLHYYHPESEYRYIDSLMSTHFGVDLSQQENRIPTIWKSLSFGNIYFPTLWWTWWLALVLAAVLWYRRRDAYELLVIAPLLLIPIVFHLVYISYRPRFLAPYLVLLGMLVLWEARELWMKRKDMDSVGQSG